MENYNSIEVTKQLVKDGKISQEIAETIFPELNESEDERIRKALIRGIKSVCKEEEVFTEGFTRKQIVSWLEKQGEQNPQNADSIPLDCTSDAKNENTWHKVEDSLPDNTREVLCKDAIGNFFIGRYYKNDGGCWEVSMYDEPDKSNKDNPPVLMWANIPSCEQNLANSEKTCKDEPKFKVGDWVVNTITKEVEQVIELTCCEYICSGHLIISFNEQHLLKRWTIQDAKDGDVLSFNDGHGNDCIELIKSITDKKIEFWFCLTNGNRYEVFDGITPYTNLVSRENATPATKEQRDTLFAKIHEAGYEWDAEKKELKKIEQKPAYKIKICSGDKVFTDTEIEKVCELPPGTIASLFVSSQKQDYLKWSEDDEQYLLVCKNALAKYQTTDKWDAGIISHWLEDKFKLLKERCTWKPSDEQIKAFEHFVRSLGESGYMSPYDPSTKIVYSLLNDLKKLTE